MNFAFGDYIVEISTSLKDPEETEFYIGVGTLENDPMLGEITYFSLFKNWEGSVSVKDGNDVNVPKNGLKLLNRVVDYVHTLKHPDPHKKPKIMNHFVECYSERSAFTIHVKQVELFLSKESRTNRI